jgi:hypothetical protein
MYKTIMVWACGITNKVKKTRNKSTSNMTFLSMVNLLNYETLNKNPKQQDGSPTHLNQ